VRRSLARDVAAIGAAILFVGISYGAIARADRVPVWAIVVMSVLVFAGGSQFLAVGLLAAGNPVAAVAGGLLLNARHLPFGLSTGDLWDTDAGGRARRLGRRLVGSHLMVDESVAFALGQPDRTSAARAYWLTGGTLFTVWNLGTLLGIVVGGEVGDPATFGFDAAFPAGLLALLMPQLRQRVPRRVAVLGAAVAVLATPLLPAGVPVLLALLGLVAVIGR
jgi:4-azaleucine resistance transporter AzlC